MTTTGPEAVASTGRRFLVHACLGRGGFGEVYRATMSSSGGVRTEVAIKVLRGDIDPGSDSVKRLRDEGRLLGALRHPAILRVHDLVLLENRVALVTEYVEGDDLDKCMTGTAPMPARTLVGVIGEVASALDAAWTTTSPTSGDAIHLVHRDVKPANIRIGRHGEVKLLDFGIARATNVVREAQTANNAMMGSYLYMAPERFHEEKVEPPSDVYALGCVLYEGITGKRLFEGMTLKQIYGTMLLTRKFNAHIDARFAELPEDLDPRVRQLLADLLAASPDQRPSAAEVARRCEDLVEALPGNTLKRWARSRDWPAPQHQPGVLDGRELSAQSFGISEADARAVAEETFVHQGPMAADAPLAAPESLPPVGASFALPPIDFGMGMGGPPVPMDAPAPRRVEPQPGSAGSSFPPVTAGGVAASQPGEARVPSPSVAPVAAPGRSPTPPPVDPRLAAASVPTYAEPEEEVPVATPPPPAPRPQSVAPAPSAAPRAVPPPPPAPAPANLGPTLGEPQPTFSSVEAFDRISEPGIDPMPGILGHSESVAEDRDDEFDASLRELQARTRRRNIVMAVAGVGVLGLVVLVGLGLAVFTVVTGSQLASGETSTPEPGSTVAARPSPAPAPEPSSEVQPEPAPAQPEPAPARPEPAPAQPAPAPAPAQAEPAPVQPAPAAPAPKPSAKGLVDQGWNQVDRDPSKALSLFDQALQLSPSADAWYGKGYALMQLGHKDDAQSAYCKAIATSTDAGTTREVKSVMSEHGMSCN